MYTYYWPSAKSRWLDFGQVLFSALWTYIQQYPAIMTKLAWSRKDLLYGSRNTEKNLRTYLFLSSEREARKPVVCKSNSAFCFLFRFLVLSWQGKHRKSFYFHGKCFVKENFRALVWTSAKCYCGNKTDNPEWAVSLHFAHARTYSTLLTYWRGGFNFHLFSVL